MASLVGAPPPPSEPPDPDLDVVLLDDPRDPPVPPDPLPPLPLSNPPSFHLFAHSELLPHIDLVWSPFISARAASVVRDHHWSVSSSSSPRSANLVPSCQGLQRTTLLLPLQPITTQLAIDVLTTVEGQLSTTGSCSVPSKPPFDAAPGTCAFMLSLIELDDKLTWLVSCKLQIHHGNVGFQSICLSSTIAYSLTLVKVTRQGVSSYNDTSSSANDTPLQSCCCKHKSEQYLVEALLQKLPQPGFTSENCDVRYFTPRFSEFDNWQCGFNFVKTSWHHHGNAGTKTFCRNSISFNALEVLVKLHSIVIVVNVATFSLFDSHCPCFQASTGSLCFSANIMLADDSVSFGGFKAVHALTLEFSTLKVLSNSLMLIRAIFGNLHSKEIIGIVKDI
ncbi:BnaC05g26920D [Brassica napus]|uniref:Uncharacterized protein n=3 Tax=Brassica TaxID=3705 RepID=A0A3P6EXC4_BRAOL|nr:unnamed protein product [Brassica napus]CDY07330.1 BnaC05g26920D [Brassica napus]VDD44510.1 unnamed protein product [Brassica oleracea]